MICDLEKKTKLGETSFTKLDKFTLNMFPGFRYIFIIAFFALLSGFFHPFLTGSNPAIVLIGVIVLFIGLAGAILLYKTATFVKKPGVFVMRDGLISYKTGSSTRRIIFFIGGAGLIITSLIHIYQITGRI